MKKFRGSCLLIVLVLIAWLIALPAGAVSDTSSNTPYTGNNGSVTNGCHTIDAQRPLLGSDRMLKTAGSVFVYEINSDTVVYGYNPDERVQPASLVKIMTALLALEQGNLEDVVTVTANALAPIPDYAATLQLKSGEQFTLDQLMYCLLVGSANDAANVIAEHISGSIRAFVAEMNNRAIELGCTNTFFKNAHGLNEEGQYSSARDMAKILRAALEYEQFKVYFGAQDYKVPATSQSEARYLATTNYMIMPGASQIYYDKRVTGGRTGVTDERERSLISTAESGGLSYINVVLNCIPTFAHDDWTVIRFGSYEETRDLLNIVCDNLKVTQVLFDEQILTQFTVLNGENAVAAGPTMNVWTVLPGDISIDELNFQYLDNPGMVNAPISDGEYIATVQVWYGTVCLAQSPLVARNNVSVSAAKSGTSQQAQTGDALVTGLTIVAVLIVVGVGGSVVLYLVQSYNLAAARARRRRRSKNRRRSR